MIQTGLPKEVTGLPKKADKSYSPFAAAWPPPATVRTRRGLAAEPPAERSTRTSTWAAETGVRGGGVLSCSGRLGAAAAGAAACSGWRIMGTWRVTRILTSPTAALSSAAPWVADLTFSPLIEMTVSPTCRPAAFARNAAGLQVFSELIVTTGAGAPCNTMPHLVLAVGLLNVKGTGSLVCKGVAQWAWMCCGRGEAAYHTCLPDGGTAGGAAVVDATGT